MSGLIERLRADRNGYPVRAYVTDKLLTEAADALEAAEARIAILERQLAEAQAEMRERAEEK